MIKPVCVGRACAIGAGVFAAAVFACMASVQADEEAPPSIIQNGGFEKQLDGWEFADGSAAGKTFSIDSSTPISGAFSLKIDSQDKDGVSTMAIPVDVRPGNLYTVKYQGRFNSGDGYVSILIRERRDGGVSDYVSAFGNTTFDKNDSNKTGVVVNRSGYYYFSKPSQYLVIQAHGSIQAELDNIEITVEPDAGKRFSGFWLQKVPWVFHPRGWESISEHAPVFPHAQLSGKEDDIRLLYLSDTWRARNAVEMQHRFNILPTVVGLSSLQTSFGQEGSLLDYFVHDNDGQTRLVRARQAARQKLDGTYDAILIRDVLPCDIPDDFVNHLAAMVAEGSGLVIVLDPTLNAWPYRGTAVTLADQKNSKVAPGPELQALRLASIRESAFKAWAGVLDGKNKLSTVPEFLSGEIRDAKVEFFSHGKGRVAIVNEFNSFAGLANTRRHYESELSLLAKLLRWSCGRNDALSMRVSAQDQEPGSPVAGVYGKPVSLSYRFSGPLNKESVVQWWVEDDYGTVNTKGEFAITGETVTFELPAVPSGNWHLSSKVVDAGKVLDWDCTGLLIAPQGAPRLTEIAFQSPSKLSPSFEAPGPIRGVVKADLSGATTAVLELTVYDHYGNQWGKTTYPLAPVVEFALPVTWDIQSSLHYLKARVLIDHRIVGEKISPEMFLRKNSVGAKQFEYGSWNVGGGVPTWRESYLSSSMYHPVAETGISQNTSGFNNRGLATANVRVFSDIRFSPPHSVAKGTESAPQMVPSLASPSYKSSISERVQKELGSSVEWFGDPAAYKIYHEYNLQGFSGKGGQDFDFSEYAVKSMQEFLAKDYGLIDKLNKAWGENYASFAEAQPITFKEVKNAQSAVRWMDFRRAMDRMFGDNTLEIMNNIRAYDPQARVVADNLLVPDAWSGVDLSMLYSESIAGVSGLPFPSLLEKNNRDLYQKRAAYWHANRLTAHANLHAARSSKDVWSTLLEGYHGYNIWSQDGHGLPNTSVAGRIFPDLSKTGWSDPMDAAVYRIREGLDRLLFDAQRQDTVLALYSRPGIISKEVTGKLAGIAPGLLTSRLADVFEKSGYYIQYISEKQIAEGALDAQASRVLLLPFCQSLSDKTVEKLQKFAGKGGVLIADLRPAVTDEHGILRPVGGLDKVFGVEQDTRWEKVAKGNATVSGVTMPAILPVGLKKTSASTPGEEQILLTNRYQSGTALLLNFLPESLDSKSTAAILASMGASLPPLSATVVPLSEDPNALPAVKADQNAGDKQFGDPEGHMAGDGSGEVQRKCQSWERGTIRVLGIYTEGHRGIGEEELKIELADKKDHHWYDLTTGTHAGYGSSIQAKTPLEGIAVYACLPYQIPKPGLVVQKPETLNNGLTKIGVSASFNETMGDGHVVCFKLFGPPPEKKEISRVTKDVHSQKAAHDFVLPGNAAPGLYTVEALESISRQSASEQMEILK